ncbi:MAG: cytosine permease [Acidobacteriota bacterium]
MRAVDLSPIRDDEQTERPFDLFLIFVGANIVATTLQVGASLPSSFTLRVALAVIAVGAIGGAGLVAALAPIGTRLRVPSIVATRAALGLSGASTLAMLLFTTNFVWIALNNVIAGSIAVRLSGGGSIGAWAAGLGLLATLVVLRGPHAVARFNRVAVPMMFLAGAVFTAALIGTPIAVSSAAAVPLADTVRGLDVVTGYQVSWLLMFADFPRFVRSPRAAGAAVFLGLAMTAMWFMPLGLAAASIAQSADPGSMITAVGIGWWGALLIALATVTTNFVNIYMSALALRSLRPSSGDAATVWLIGGIGAALGMLSTTWIDQFASFVLLLGGVFVPIGGILLAHYFVLKTDVHVPDLYDANGPYARRRGWSLAGTLAWVSGGTVYYLAQPIGGSLPGLVASMLVYVIVSGRDATVRRRP